MLSSQSSLTHGQAALFGHVLHSRINPFLHAWEFQMTLSFNKLRHGVGTTLVE